MVLGNVDQAVQFQVVGGRGSGTGATARWGGRGCERHTLHPEPTFKPLHLRLTPLAWFHSGHGRVGTTRLQVRKAQSARKYEILVAGNRWHGTALARKGSLHLVPRERTRRVDSLRRRLRGGHIGATVATPHALGSVGQSCTANSAGTHGVAAKQAHAHAMLCV